MNVAGYEFADLARLALWPLVALVGLYVAKLISDRLTPFDDDHMIEEQANAAYAMRRAGMYLALSFAIAGAARAPTNTAFPDNLLWFAIDGLVACIVVGVCVLIGRKLTFPGISTREAIAHENIAIGWVELGARLALGIVAFAAFQGEGDLQGAIVFTLLSQLVLVGSFYLFTLINKFDLRAELKDGNAAAGIMSGGWMVSLGLILGASVASPPNDWITDLAGFGGWAVFGLVLLMLFTWIGDWLFLPKSTSEQQISERRNVAAAGLLTGLNVGLAAIVAATIL